MREKIIKSFKETTEQLFSVSDIEVELTRPEEKFGDYATNLALKLSKELNMPPREIADKIQQYLSEYKPKFLEEITVAGPGFINIKITETELLKQSEKVSVKTYKDLSVVAEYSDANPFKVLHVGHLYTTIVGDSIANILSYSGAKVHRINFGGDVGLHVAKNIWAMLTDLGAEDSKLLNKINKDKRSEWLSACYVKGNNAYEENDKAQEEIKTLNKRIYKISYDKDKESELGKIYWKTREWSYQAFDEFYSRIGAKFDKYIPESEIAELGTKIVLENVPKVYEKSNGAIVFKGENHNLFTNVFINSEGLPTYGAKDVGLIFKKWQDYRFDKSIIITSSEQEMYMKVVQKSIEQFRPELSNSSIHFTHGFVRLVGGTKMSSRLGNILGANEVLDITKKFNKHDDPKEEIMLAAVKYSFLKHRVGSDIIFDPKESVSLEGNSGPYLQYAHARAQSILGKADLGKLRIINLVLEDGERSLLRKLAEFKEVIELCGEELKSHYLCTYLYELTQVFNRFYEKNRVIGDERERIRLKLVDIYASHLKTGLGLLGIVAPDKM